MKKYLFPLTLLTALTVSCGSSDTSKTDDGMRADGQVQTDNFESNPQVSEDVRTRTTSASSTAAANNKDSGSISKDSAKNPVSATSAALAPAPTEPKLAEVTGNPAIREKDVPPASASTTSKTEGNVVRRVQDELNRRGVKAPRNGYLGDETKIAIKTFQRTEGLEPTGNLTETTLKALGISVSSDNREPASVME